VFWTKRGGSYEFVSDVYSGDSFVATKTKMSRVQYLKVQAELDGTLVGVFVHTYACVVFVVGKVRKN
jgi:hypothetical protein